MGVAAAWPTGASCGASRCGTRLVSTAKAAPPPPRDNSSIEDTSFIIRLSHRDLKETWGWKRRSTRAPRERAPFLRAVTKEIEKELARLEKELARRRQVDEPYVPLQVCPAK